MVTVAREQETNTVSITTQSWTSLETINDEMWGALSTAEEFGQDDAIEGFIALVEGASRVSCSVRADPGSR